MVVGARVIAVPALALWPFVAAAQTPPVLVADALLAPLAAAAPRPRDLTADWRLLPGDDLPLRACAADLGMGGRLLLTIRPLTPRETDRCATLGHGPPLTERLGWQSLFLVAKATEWAGLQSAQLYLALVASVPVDPGGALAANRAQRWRDLGPELPDDAIRVLVPARDTPLAELFARSVLEPGCLAASGARRLFSPDERVRTCTTLRDDDVVVRAEPGTDPIAWLVGQPAHALAVVSQAEIARIGDDLVVLPLDGVVPTYTAVTSGDYPASWAVYLTLVAAAPGDAATDAAVALAAESVSGPAGTLGAAGLTPQPAAARVALRTQLFAFGGS